ncbi:MAG: hypothetical protein O2880_12530 [Proteobacteria bacterium]|nr:hypothetical protein [Pseudomonadota bacterium]
MNESRRLSFKPGFKPDIHPVIIRVHVESGRFVSKFKPNASNVRFSRIRWCSMPAGTLGAGSAFNGRMLDNNESATRFQYS